MHLFLPVAGVVRSWCVLWAPPSPLNCGVGSLPIPLEETEAESDTFPSGEFTFPLKFMKQNTNTCTVKKSSNFQVLTLYISWSTNSS